MVTCSQIVIHIWSRDLHIYTVIKGRRHSRPQPAFSPAFRIGTPPCTPSYAGECVPSGSGGKTHSLEGDGVGGVPIPTRGQADTVVLWVYCIYMYFVMEPYAILSLSLSLYLCGCVQALRGRAVAPQLRAAREPPGGREPPPTRGGGGEGEGSLAPCLLASRLTQPRLPTLPQARNLPCMDKIITIKTPNPKCHGLAIKNSENRHQINFFNL
jgi:hypothetical protein